MLAAPRPAALARGGQADPTHHHGAISPGFDTPSRPSPALPHRTPLRSETNVAPRAAFPILGTPATSPASPVGVPNPSPTNQSSTVIPKSRCGPLCLHLMLGPANMTTRRHLTMPGFIFLTLLSCLELASCGQAPPPASSFRSSHEQLDIHPRHPSERIATSSAIRMGRVAPTSAEAGHPSACALFPPRRGSNPLTRDGVPCSPSPRQWRRTTLQCHLSGTPPAAGHPRTGFPADPRRAAAPQRLPLRRRARASCSTVVPPAARCRLAVRPVPRA